MIKRGLVFWVLVHVAAPVLADTFTVLPGASIQAAIDAAIAAGGDNEVKVAAGDYTERLKVRDLVGGSLTLSGGWVAPAFAVRTGPGATVLHGGEIGPVVQIRAEKGDPKITFTGFTVTGCTPCSTDPADVAPAFINGAVWVVARDASEVHVLGNVIRDNHVSGKGLIEAAGLHGEVLDDGRLYVSGNLFADNTAFPVPEPDGAAEASGAYIYSFGYVSVSSNQFLHNQGPFDASGFDTTAGLDLFCVDGLAEAYDNVLESNSLRLWTGATTSRLIARRNSVRHSLGAEQVHLSSDLGARLVFSDSLVANGAGAGIGFGPREAEYSLTNLTIVDNAGSGVANAGGGGTVDITNSILFGNGTAIEGSATVRSSIVEEDPGFVDRPHDYRLSYGSIGIDAGLNPPPEGELGPLDLDRTSRVSGAGVDIGAYEVPWLGVPPGLACRVLNWRSGLPEPAPIPDFTNVCRCLTDASLRELNCGFVLPDMFLSLRSPLGWTPGQPVFVSWGIDPWTDVAAPYAMHAEARIDGQWVPQSWLGPSAQALKQGKLTVEPFRLKLPSDGRTELRMALKYWRAGAPDSSELSVEVLMPEPAPLPQ